MSDLFWLSKSQLNIIKPYFPPSRGVPRVDDQRVISGIIHVLKPVILLLTEGQMSDYKGTRHNEQVAMRAVMKNPAAGTELRNFRMNDPRWPGSQGWVKMAKNVNGVEIHYVRHRNTGAVGDFKFVK